MAPSPSKGQQHSNQRRGRRIVRYEQVPKPHRQGLSQRTTMAQLKRARRRLMKLPNAGVFPERAKPQHTQQADLHVDPLRQRWSEGIGNARALTRYNRTLGYTGGHDMARRRVRGTLANPR